MTQKALAEKLARTYGTRDPFRIAEALGFIIIETPLEGIRGFYQAIHRCRIIYLDNRLSDGDGRWVCAHELGHALQHQGCNRIFMDTRTHMVTSPHEKKADRFAADLRFSDHTLRDMAAPSHHPGPQCLGVSYELAAYRMASVAPAA